MVNFALQTRKTSKNHDFFMKNQAKSLIFHGFPCQNFPAVNPSSRHAYRGAVRPRRGLPSRVLKNHRNYKKVRKNVSQKVGSSLLEGRFYRTLF